MTLSILYNCVLKVCYCNSINLRYVYTFYTRVYSTSAMVKHDTIVLLQFAVNLCNNLSVVPMVSYSVLLCLLL